MTRDDSRPNRSGKFLDAFLSLPGWLDWLAKAWPWLAALGGAGAMGWLGGATAWINRFAPLSWGLVSLATFVVLLTAFSITAWLLANAARNRAAAVFATKAAESATANPLEKRFFEQRISFKDFYSPFFETYKDKVFEDCEIFGPANVVFFGSPTLDSCNFIQCDFVEVREGAMTASVTAFDSPRFYKCTLYRVTIFMTPRDAEHLVQASGGAVQFVTERHPPQPANPAPQPNPAG